MVRYVREPEINCLTGCGEKFKVEPVWDRAPNEFIADSQAPVIKATLIDSGISITVGNESYPTNEHKAVIKSIDFGFMNSNEGSMEIIDEEGGVLSTWLDHVNKCGSTFVRGHCWVKIQIGWAYTTCEGFKNVVWSPEVTSNIGSVESNLSNGLIRFIVKITTADNFAKNYREHETFGQEKGNQEMSLEDAITQIMALCPQMNVEFGYYNESNQLIKGRNKLEWLVNKRVELGGPKASWKAGNKNRFDTIVDWMSRFRIKDGDKDKGTVLINDPQKPNTLLILKDPSPDVSGFPSDGKGIRHVGTFIVNGGQCSNVLEFNPTFNMVRAVAQQTAGGGTKGGIGTDNEQASTVKTPTEKQQCDTAGVQRTITPSQECYYTEGKDAPTETNKSQQAHIRAHRIFEIEGTVLEAELRIVGTTHFTFYQSDAICQMCSIVVISPFTIRGGKTNVECGDFLKKAECHEIFSNRKWIIKGVHHSVKEGSFVTTLKVVLYSPIHELDMGAPFGGDPNGGTLSGC